MKSRYEIVLGLLFAQMGRFYGWASPDYLLWRMTLSQFFHYWDMMIWLTTGDPPAWIGDKPDLVKAYELYGDRIKRPEPVKVKVRNGPELDAGKERADYGFVR